MPKLKLHFIEDDEEVKRYLPSRSEVEATMEKITDDLSSWKLVLQQEDLNDSMKQQAEASYLASSMALSEQKRALELLDELLQQAKIETVEFKMLSFDDLLKTEKAANILDEKTGEWNTDREALRDGVMQKIFGENVGAEMEPGKYLEVYARIQEKLSPNRRAINFLQLRSGMRSFQTGPSQTPDA